MDFKLGHYRKHGGARPGAGRKSKIAELGIIGLLDERLTIEKRRKIIDNLYQLAIGDNPKAAVGAASFLFAYAYGKPTEHIQHEILDPKKIADETSTELREKFPDLTDAQLDAIIYGTFGDVAEHGQIG